MRIFVADRLYLHFAHKLLVRNGVPDRNPLEPLCIHCYAKEPWLIKLNHLTYMAGVARDQ